MTSPTFGGISWLAHSTLQTGLWVNNVQRYAQLTASNRLTLSDAFNKAGWRTVADVPSNEKSWPEGKTFYHYDQLYNQFNVGYAGPNFSYAKVPDQYTLAKFQQLELAPGHAPVFAEIDLDSSHTPWAPLPHMVPENALGNGSIYDGDARARSAAGNRLAQRSRRAGQLWSIRPVLDDRTHLVAADRQRQEPRGDRTRRPPARDDR